MLKRATFLVGSFLLGIVLTGCGEGETEHGIPKSPYAPTQAQLDELTKQTVKQYAHAPKARRRH